MLRQEVKKIIEELDSDKLSQKTEQLIKKILVASVEVYEDPDQLGLGMAVDAFDQVFENPDYPTTLED